MTPISVARIKKQIVKIGKLKMSGAQLESTTQYYKIKPREPQKMNQVYLEITRKNVAFLQINKNGSKGIQDKNPLYKAFELIFQAIMRNGRSEEQSNMLALDAMFVARSNQDLHQKFYKYLNDEELFSTGSFMDHLGMKYKEHLPQYKAILLKKRQWEQSSCYSFYQFEGAERYFKRNDKNILESGKKV